MQNGEIRWKSSKKSREYSDCFTVDGSSSDDEGRYRDSWKLEKVRGNK